MYFYISGSISDLRGFGSGLARFEAGSVAEARGGQLQQLAHVNVDELSDDGVANVINELKVAVRQFGLETIMFEGTCKFCLIQVGQTTLFAAMA